MHAKARMRVYARFSLKQQAGASGAGPKSQGGWMILPVILHHKGFCKVQKRL
jgi:hypothetical protein